MKKLLKTLGVAIFIFVITFISYVSIRIMYEFLPWAIWIIAIIVVVAISYDIVNKDEVEQMAELKKCPFCGGEAELNYYGSESIPFYSVSCKECGCNQETSIHKEAVINAWNIRETEAEIRAKAIDEFAEKAIKIVYESNNRRRNPQPRDMVADIHYKLRDLAEQLKEE